LSFSITTTNKQLRIDETVAMQNDLAKIGIELKPDLAPGGTVFATYAGGGPLATGKFDLGGGLNGFTPEPSPGTTFSCATVPSKDLPTGDNWTHLCDPKLDQLVDATNATADPALRKQAFDALQKYMYDQAYIIYMYVFPSVVGYSSRLVFPAFSDYSGWAWDTFEWDVK
jgi:ABC-type transport system substrate-binding protein